MKKNTIRVVRKSSLSAAVSPSSFSFQTEGLSRKNGGTVHRVQRALSLERSWRKDGTGPEGDRYKGYFHATGMKFRGKATVSPTAIDIYIKHPPPELHNHRHWRCFFPRKNGWYWIHHTSQAGLDSAILEIEAILNECRPRHHPAQNGQQGAHARSQTPSNDNVAKIVKFLTKLFG